MNEIKYGANTKRKIWLIAPGERAKYWDICVNRGIICAGWREAVEELKEKLIGIQDKATLEKEMTKFGYSNQDSGQLWKFLREVSKGDIVLAKKGAEKIIGVGVVKSEPKIDLELGEYPIYRKVKWYRTNLDLDSPKYFVQTITDVEKDVEKVPELKKIIEEVINEDSKKESGLEDSKLLNLLESKKQIILYGPPGTGKTWLAKKFVDENASNIYERAVFVTFHPSYSYEEFVEGLKPLADEKGNIRYEVEDGIFKRICRNAYNALMHHAGVSKRWERDLPQLDETEISLVRNSIEDAPRFFLIIDEINRGDISKIFGELITLLEADKRLFAENEIVTTLPYSKEPFGVPPNLYIIGTMNTADRSIALIDVALRRRFGFIELMPDYGVLIRELGIGEAGNEEQAIEMITEWSENEIKEDVKKLAVKALYVLNQKIQLIYDRDHQIGHSYLLKLKDGSIETLRFIWYHEIIPLLQEYFYNDWRKLEYLLGKFIEEKKATELADFELVDEEDARIYIIKDLSGEEFINAMLSVVISSRSAE